MPESFPILTRTKVVPVGRRLAAMVSTLHRWFTLRRDSLRVAFECDERLRGALESMSGDLTIVGEFVCVSG